MKYLNLFIILFSIHSISFSQTFSEEFYEAFNTGDTTKQALILKNWEKHDTNDPDRYICLFNYYFNKSIFDLTIYKEYSASERPVYYDHLGKNLGYRSIQAYNWDLLKKGYDILDQGIEHYPDRLDMRYGKISALRQTEDWTSFTNEIIKIIQYSAMNNNKWTWTNNEHIPNGEEALFSAVQDYQYDLFNTGEDSLLCEIKMIEEEVLNYYRHNKEVPYYLADDPVLNLEYSKEIQVKNTRGQSNHSALSHLSGISGKSAKKRIKSRVRI